MREQGVPFLENRCIRCCSGEVSSDLASLGLHLREEILTGDLNDTTDEFPLGACILLCNLLIRLGIVFQLPRREEHASLQSPELLILFPLNALPVLPTPAPISLCDAMFGAREENSRSWLP